MRAILVAGMMVAAGAAGAADFGIGAETARDRMSALKPSVEFIECKDGGCSFRSDQARIGVTLMAAENRAVDGFAVFFGESGWAIAADYIHAIQREFLVPAEQMVDVRRAAERVVEGNEDVVTSKYILCRSEAGKAGSKRFSIFCTRPR